MTAVVAPIPAADNGSLLARLLTTVRPPFQAKLIRIDPDDPVFAGDGAR